ncbi:D-alanyl-D-alanine carboxypeptidase [Clostridium disporicum]|uniref:D-alanyl-D-alanine carboxypeptidase n=1 Tax=Clostridium disporicum TaxID=84024 RepID=A0A174G5L6_9CLOT|nr:MULTISPECIES: D-alanyl-D-alanine carboxypeptidase family protein [Clostridium]MCD2500165.1 D-alanyl-D-alanine carboxypeptidase [Clostridium sp. NSJ-145]CUO56428.1 D-alanyl-D-alanine carboxypeptidase [Clostridium disporicum]
MNRKTIIKVICSILLIMQSYSICSASVLFEEDSEEMEDEIIITEDREINDVDNSLVLDKLRVNARNAIAIDGTTRQILYEQNCYEVVPMASTTKILTALVALNEGDLDRELTVTKNAASIRGSKVGYKAGETIKLRELLYGLMLKSGNDAAITIAEGLGGSIENFSKIMNHYATSLGLTTSHFETPHGLDSQKHYSSAYDLAILTAKAMENDTFKEICGEKLITQDKYNFTREYQNINKILWKIPDANGVKTGYTGGAGKCLVSSVKHEGRNIIIVVLNCSDRWNVTEKIFNYVCTNYDFKKESNSEIIKSNAISNLGSIVEEADFQYGSKEKANLEVEVFKPIMNVLKGDIIGKISLKDEGNEVLRQEIRCNKNISKDKYDTVLSMSHSDKEDTSES